MQFALETLWRQQQQQQQACQDAKERSLLLWWNEKKNSRRQKSAFAFPLFFFSAANGCSPICCRKWKFKFLTNAEQAGQKVFQLHFFTAAVTAAGKFHTFPTAHFRNLFFVSIFFFLCFLSTNEGSRQAVRESDEWMEETPRSRFYLA